MVDRIVELPQVQHVVREVPKIEVEEVVREVVKLNKEVRERTVEVFFSFFELPEKTPVA